MNVVHLSSPGNPVGLSLHDKERARKALDDQLAFHTTSILQLNAQRNELTTASSLPVEILCSIFQLIATASPPVRLDQLPSPKIFGQICQDRYKWTIVTQVCRRWRKAAFSFPRLWNYVNTSDIELASRCLKRSASAPLEVAIRSGEWDISMSSYKHFHDRFIKNLSRLVKLTLVFDGHNSRLLDSFVKPASRLTTLTLCAPDPGDIVHISPKFFSFSNQLPKLRNLTLSFVSIPWVSPLIRGLTNLALIDVPITAQPDHIVLINILKHCPCLEVLRLARSGPKNIPENQHARAMVETPQLKEFIMVLDARDCMNFIAHLKVPLLSKLQLAFRTGPVLDFKPFASKFPPLNFHPHRSSGKLGITITLSMTGVSVVVSEITETGVESRGDVTLVWGPFPYATNVVVCSLLAKMLPLSAVAHAHLICPGFDPTLRLDELLNTFPSLTSLTFEAENPASDEHLLKELCSALIPLSDTTHGVDCRCPQLKTLDLCLAMPKDRKGTMELFENFLMRRANNGMKLKELVVRDRTGFSTDERMMLEKVVEKFVWVRHINLIGVREAPNFQKVATQYYDM
ncbi:hypothetical protein BD410DRAFT_794107 [Rickenella mellea]|uniref:Uncharacterized protein n=1 Tax=Rickenella mellea TaxID=50990 RepID=A0A4Y7PR57_9AGAM|nr:hypothetical protein BD410DRAFT_794107 [Rickenella mellea]